MSNQNRYHSTAQLPKCYNIDRGLVERLSQSITQRTSSAPNISISTNNSNTVSSNSVSSIFDDTIFEVSKIKDLQITSSFNRASRIDSVSITIDSSRLLEPISLSLTGDKDAVSNLREEIKQIFAGAVAWYWPINIRNAHSYSILYILLVVIPALTVVYYQSASFRDYFGVSTIYLYYIFLFISVLAYAGILSDMRNFLFPVIQFRIGKSGRSARMRDRIRSFFLLTVCAGLLVSWIGSYVYDKFR